MPDPTDPRPSPEQLAAMREAVRGMLPDALAAVSARPAVPALATGGDLRPRQPAAPPAVSGAPALSSAPPGGAGVGRLSQQVAELRDALQTLPQGGAGPGPLPSAPPVPAGLSPLPSPRPPVDFEAPRPRLPAAPLDLPGATPPLSAAPPFDLPGAAPRLPAAFTPGESPPPSSAPRGRGDFAPGAAAPSPLPSPPLSSPDWRPKLPEIPPGIAEGFPGLSSAPGAGGLMAGVGAGASGDNSELVEALGDLIDGLKDHKKALEDFARREAGGVGSTPVSPGHGAATRGPFPPSPRASASPSVPRHGR